MKKIINVIGWKNLLLVIEKSLSDQICMLSSGNKFLICERVEVIGRSILFFR